MIPRLVQKDFAFSRLYTKAQLCWMRATALKRNFSQKVANMNTVTLWSRVLFDLLVQRYNSTPPRGFPYGPGCVPDLSFHTQGYLGERSTRYAVSTIITLAQKTDSTT